MAGEQHAAGADAADRERKLKEGRRIAAELGFSSASLPSGALDADHKWPKTHAHFAGWAPTVSSRFTFSMVGEPRGKDTHTVNLEEPSGKRRVAHFAKRETRDAFPGSKVRKQSKFYCYMVGETEATSQLRPNIAGRLGLEAEGGDIHKVEVVSGTSSQRSDPESSTVNGGPASLRSVTAENGKMTGFVFMFLQPAKVKPAVATIRARLSLYSDLPKKIRWQIDRIAEEARETGRCREWVKKTSFMDTATQPIVSFLEAVGDENPIFVARFEIHRTGEVRIFLEREGLPKLLSIPVDEDEFNRVPEDWHVAPHDLSSRPWLEGAKGSRMLRIHRDHFFNEAASEFVKYRRIRIVEPIFDFLRDMIHRHYHHESIDDRMVNVRLVDRHNDHQWRLETLQWLMTMVQRRRRKGKEPDLRDALGILSYVDAFQTQVASHKRCPEDFRRFKENVDLRPHVLSHLERSLKVELERREKYRSTNQQLVLIFTSIAVASIAAVQNALSGAENGDSTVMFPLVEWVGLTQEFSISHPFSAAVVWAVTGGLLACGLFEIASERLTTEKILSRVQRLSNSVFSALAADFFRWRRSLAFGKLLASLISVSLGIALIAATLGALSLAIKSMEGQLFGDIVSLLSGLWRWLIGFVSQARG